MTNDINKGLDHLPQTTPPDSVWDNIEQTLDKEKRRKFPIWILYTSGAAASLAILVAAWFVYNGATETPLTVKNAPPTTHQHKPSNNELSEIKIVEENKDIGAKEKQSTSKGNSSKAIQITDSSLVHLNLTSTNGCLSYTPDANTWSFGNGTTALGATSYNYAAPIGTYSIALTNNLNVAASPDYNVNFAPDFEQPVSFEWNLTEGRFNDGLLKETEEDLSESLTTNLGMYSDSLLWDIGYEEPESGESYAPLIENEYLSPFSEPLSTFSIDVDNASYSNARRMVEGGEKPPKDAIRIEEFINYFDYDYVAPKGDVPFNIYMETASCPWNKNTQIVAIGLQGKEIEQATLPASNLVFLIDVSGSMEEENKLPLVKKTLKLLVDQMGPKDRISVVTYAGAAGLALPSTACSEKQAIKSAIDNLDAGGSTAGGEGLELAYKIAGENYVKNGNNRIILVTDGDFNVGQHSDEDMESLIELKRTEGVFLTVCGFGMGNYKDSKMEILADKGNGNYYYIDNFKESKKVFVTDLTGTLFTIAKDVKIQVEFNPKFVKAYRLIGYENRKMPPQDFDDDTKDAGELGAGHTVTALYEIIPVGSTQNIEGFFELKYQETERKTKLKDYGNELLTAKLRYKNPDQDVSKLLVQTLVNNSQSYEKASENLRFACGVTAYAMLLRDSKFKGDATYTLAKQLLQSTKLNVANGYREELLQLITKTEQLSQ
jgi:Ca-activated chloride channel family protein